MNPGHSSEAVRCEAIAARPFQELRQAVRKGAFMIAAGAVQEVPGAKSPAPPWGERHEMALFSLDLGGLKAIPLRMRQPGSPSEALRIGPGLFEISTLRQEVS